jgi:hypothetical protein
MFIQRPDRVPGMMRSMTLRAVEAPRDAAIPNRPAGVVIATDHPKMMRPAGCARASGAKDGVT